MILPELCAVPWHQSRADQCDVYAGEFLIGSFRVAELAAEAVAAHNARITARATVKAEIEERRG